MRKKSFILPLIIIVLIGLISFSSCEKKEPLTFIVNGDIEDYKIIDINNYEKISFKDYDDNKLKGYKLSDVFEDIETISDENWLMITAKDKVTARVEYSSAELIYIVVDEGKLNVEAPQLPRMVGIKDIEDITVISKSELNSGLRIISDNENINISYGNIKLTLFEQTAENYMSGNVAYKHLPKQSFKVKDLTGKDKNIIYFDNQDIIKDLDEGYLLWDEGELCYKKDNDMFRGVFGIIAGVDAVLSDAFYVMKDALDNNEKVMFILPDGLSIGQIEHYNEDLQFLSSDYSLAASVHPAISNVALASIITGCSPYENGILERGVKPPKVPDIFGYALSLDKSVKYIEGNSSLIGTSVDPQLNVPDINGFTDTNVFNSSMQALEDNPDLIFVHFHGIDDINHEYSPISPQAKDKILETEDYITDLMDAFNGKVIILPDHGAITYYDEDNIARGRHGYFDKDDMIVPYYVYD